MISCVWFFERNLFATRKKGGAPVPHRTPVAQLAERQAVMREVVSSTLAGPTLRVLK